MSKKALCYFVKVKVDAGNRIGIIHLSSIMDHTKLSFPDVFLMLFLDMLFACFEGYIYFIIYTGNIYSKFTNNYKTILRKAISF